MSGRPRDFHQVQGIDDASSPPRESPLDGLRELQVGVHTGLFVDEPCAQVFGGGIGVPAVSGELERRGQRGHDLAQPDTWGRATSSRPQKRNRGGAGTARAGRRGYGDGRAPRCATAAFMTRGLSMAARSNLDAGRAESAAARATAGPDFRSNWSGGGNPNY